MLVGQGNVGRHETVQKNVEKKERGEEEENIRNEHEKEKDVFVRQTFKQIFTILKIYNYTFSLFKP